MTDLVSRDFKQMQLTELSTKESLTVNGGTYHPGAGPGGIGPVLTREDVLYAAHRVGDFFRGAWKAFSESF